MGMIANAKFLQNQLGHPIAGPQLSAKTKGLCPLQKQRKQLSSLLGVQFGGCATGFLFAQGRQTLVANTFENLANPPLGQSDRLGNDGLFEALEVQFQHAEAAMSNASPFALGLFRFEMKMSFPSLFILFSVFNQPFHDGIKMRGCLMDLEYQFNQFKLQLVLYHNDPIIKSLCVNQ